MLEFSLGIDLGKKEQIGPSTESMPVDRAFVAQSLVAVAAKIQAGDWPRDGVILDGEGVNVGGWKFALKPFKD
jgi:hypothetical protein